MSNGHRSQSNGLGVAGFVTSLVGLVLCGGLLCPIGLLLSFVALFKRPRGFAVAGFILGLIGSAWIILLVLFLFVGLGLSVAALGSVGFGIIEVGMDATKIQGAVGQHYRDHGAVPSTLSALNLDQDTLTDPWGEPYRYEIEPDGRRYSIGSAGPDGVWDTDDDVVLDQDAGAP